MRLNRLAAHSGADHLTVLVAWVVDSAAMHRATAVFPHQGITELPLICQSVLGVKEKQFGVI